MRITKIKNSKDSPFIEIHRKHEGGALQCRPNTFSEQEELEDLIRQRKDDFDLSILMKTVRSAAPTPPKYKNDDALKEYYKKCYNEIKGILRSALKGEIYTSKNTFSTIPSEDHIRKCLTRKWKSVSTYKNENKEIKSINLVEALTSCFITREQSLNHLSSYREWATYFANRKSTHLAQSVLNNATHAASEGCTQSPRKIALEKWAKTLIIKHELDLEPLKESFKVKELSDTLISSIQKKQRELDAAKYTLNKLNKNQKLGSTLQAAQDKLFHARYNVAELIKRTYRDHCYQLHQERQAKNIEETPEEKQYRLEVAKYLEKYYPIKKQNPHKKNTRKHKINNSKKLTINNKHAETPPTHPLFYLQEPEMTKRISLRIKNATLQHIIHTGKQYYYNEESYNSEQLMLIHAKESLARRFIDATAFAANNLRLSIDRFQERDILGKKDFCNSYLKLKVDHDGQATARHRISQFFNLAKGSDTEKQLLRMSNLRDLDLLQVMTPLRGAINNIRHAVIHFKGDIIRQIVDKTSFEQFAKEPEKVVIEPVSKHNKYEKYFYNTGEYPDPSFSDTPYRELLRAELAELPELQREQLRSMRLLEFYAPTDIERIITQRDLCSRNHAFTPSFHRIFTLGRRFQNEVENCYKTAHYFEHRPADEDACLAQRNALRLIYETSFISDFLQDSNAFSLAVNYVLDLNKNQAKGKAYAFEQVPIYDSRNESPKAYLAKIQSRLTQEELLKRDSGKLSRDSTGNFQSFLFYIFMKGFDQYLGKNTQRYSFINRPHRRHILEHSSPVSSCQYHLEQDLARLKLPAITHEIDANKPAHIAFWIFAKLLNQGRINELSNQILKYRVYAEKLALDYPYLKEDNAAQCAQILDILALCRLSCEKYFSSSTEEQLEQLSHYVEQERLDKEPYMQQDGQTPVLFSSIQLAHRYATDAILVPLLEPRYKVTASDITKRNEMQKSIAEKSATRQRLHRRAVAKPLSESEIIEYTKNQDFIEDYNWLDNKVKLYHIQKLHHLIIEILGRMASFINLYERNLRFCYEYIIREFPSERAKYPELNWDFGLPYLKDKGKWDEFGKEVFAPMKGKNLPSSSRIRNTIAHFNHLGNPSFALVKTMGMLRRLMSHDRKLQNAVSTSLIDLLEQHGIIIQLDSSSLHKGYFNIKSCLPKQIKHLKTIEIDQVHKEYAQMVKQMLEFHL